MDKRIRVLLKLVLERGTDLLSCFGLSSSDFILLIEWIVFLVNLQWKSISEKMVIFGSGCSFRESISLKLLHGGHDALYKLTIMGFLQGVSELILLQVLLFVHQKLLSGIFVFFSLFFLDGLRLSFGCYNKWCWRRISPKITPFNLNMMESSGQLLLFLPLLPMKVFIIGPNFGSDSIPIRLFQSGKIFKGVLKSGLSLLI